MTAAKLPQPEGESGSPKLIRVAMMLELQSPRHLFALLDENHEFLIRPNEFDESEDNNDEVFRRIVTNDAVKWRLEDLREEDYLLRTGEQPQILALEKQDLQKLDSHYFFQEGTPRDQLGKAIGLDKKEDVEAFMRRLNAEYDFLGRVYELADFQSPDAELIQHLQGNIDEAFGRTSAL